MEKRLSRWGIGPRMIVSVIVYSALAIWATFTWPGVLRMDWLDDRIRFAASGVLLALGMTLWLSGGVTVMRAYNRDELITTGPFALVRHPVYASWIVLNMPGLAILSRCWLLFGGSLVGYAVFKALIGREDEYLRKRFGQVYEDYRARVNEVLPLPRFSRR